MKQLLTIFFLCIYALVTQAIEIGKTYRITSKKYPTKSLFVTDSRREAETDIVLWTETDVPSQQWKVLSATGGTFVLQNVYTGMYLAPKSWIIGYSFQTTSTRNNGRIAIEAVDEDASLYLIHNIANNQGFSVTEDTDGSLPVLAKLDQSDEAQLWIFEEVEPKTSFTAAMRDEMMDAYVKHHLHSRGNTFKTFYDGSWGEAEQLEVLLDAYETTSNERYLTYARQVYSYFNNKVGGDWTKGGPSDYKWYGYDFNDDVMWMVIAVARLGYITGTKAYTNVAKKNFDRIYERAYIPFTGMLRWAEQTGDRYGTNSCINGPAEVAACYLGMSGCGEEYFEKARDIYAAQRKNLTINMATGKVWDNVIWDPGTEKVKSRNEWASTYNQGTMLGAACLLYLHYNDAQYLNDARKIMSYTKKELCDSYGIIKVCQDPTNQDLCGFKGILMRYVRIFVTDLQQTGYREWMLRNALRAYCNRTVAGLTGTAWLTKSTNETTTNPFGCSTAASAAVNAPIEAEGENAISILPESSPQPLSHSIELYSIDGKHLSTPPSRGIYLIRSCGITRKVLNL